MFHLRFLHDCRRELQLSDVCSVFISSLLADMNLVCNTNLTTQGSVGKCECRRDMRWNTGEGECQFYLDVDCSSFTYETRPSPNILAAVERANTAIQARPASTMEEALGEFAMTI